MSLHQIRLLIRFGILLGFAEFFDQAHGLALEAAVESATGASVNDIAELFGRKVEETVWKESLSVGAMQGNGTKMRDIVVRCSGRTCRGRCLDTKIFGRFSSSSALIDCISDQRCHENRPILWKLQHPDPISRAARLYLGAMTVIHTSSLFSVLEWIC